MKISVSSSKQARSIPAETTEIHFVRPISGKALQAILERCRELKSVSMAGSSMQRLNAKTKKVLEEKNIQVSIENRRGRAISIALQKLLDVIEMRKDYRAFRDIEQTTGIPKSTIHYLVKYAQRGKIKKGNTIVYLK